MTEQRKAIAYTRVSTSEQAISDLSLEAQRHEVIIQAKLSDVTIVQVLTDKDESASTLNRPVMSELLTHIDSGRIDAVIISKLDRLTRRIKDFKSLLQRMKKAKRAGGGKGVDLISSAESLDTGSDTGQIVINIMDSVSQWDREVIGERTSAILQDLKAQGKSTGNPNYGFEAGEDGKLIENEQEQAVPAARRRTARPGQKLGDSGQHAHKRRRTHPPRHRVQQARPVQNRKESRDQIKEDGPDWQIGACHHRDPHVKGASVTC